MAEYLGKPDPVGNHMFKVDNTETLEQVVKYVQS